MSYAEPAKRRFRIGRDSGPVLEEEMRRIQEEFFPANNVLPLRDRMRVVYAYKAVQLMHLRDLDESGQDSLGTVDAAEKVALLLGVGVASVWRIVAEYHGKGEVQERARGYFGPHPTRASGHATDHELLRSARGLVRRNRERMRFTVAKHVLRFWIRRGLLAPVDEADTKEWQLALRFTQKFLQRHGFKRGVKKGLSEKSHIEEARSRYLAALFANRQEPDPSKRLRETYIDESYVYENHNRQLHSLYDPNDSKDKQACRVPAGGRRLCFIAAIQGPNPQRRQSVSPQDKARLIPESVLVFLKGDEKKLSSEISRLPSVDDARNLLNSDDEDNAEGYNSDEPAAGEGHAVHDRGRARGRGSRGSGRSRRGRIRGRGRGRGGLGGRVTRADMGDYHKNFDGSVFQDWVRDQLLPSLHEPSLLILDNARYHSTPPEGVPNLVKMKKPQLVELAVRWEAATEADAKGLKREVLVALLKSRPQYDPRSFLEIEASKRGHRVLFTPPYHSDLQPIEFLWAVVKEKVARKHDANTTLKDTQQRLRPHSSSCKRTATSSSA